MIGAEENDMDNKAKAEMFLTLCASGNIRKAYDEYVAEGFVHHNPYFKSDAASLMTGMEESERTHPHKIFEIQRCAAEGDVVFVHSKVTIQPQLIVAVVHICKFVKGRIVELWDIGQPVPGDMINEKGMF
jgi:predicted SnoaL-like aldol condensation-catalyzing enzyme